MGLWAEHLKTWEESFRFPGTLECTQVPRPSMSEILTLTLFCIQRVKEMCDFNWQSYSFDVYGLDQMEPPPGHLPAIQPSPGHLLAISWPSPSLLLAISQPSPGHLLAIS